MKPKSPALEPANHESIDEVAELENLQSTITDMLDLTQTSASVVSSDEVEEGVGEEQEAEATDDASNKNTSENDTETPKTNQATGKRPTSKQLKEAEDRMRQHFRSKRFSNGLSAILTAILTFVFLGTTLIENPSSIWIGLVAATVSVLPIGETLMVHRRLQGLEQQSRERLASTSRVSRQVAIPRTEAESETNNDDATAQQLESSV